MAGEPDWEAIRCRDWLAHRWTFAIRERRDCGASSFEVIADGVGVATLASRAAAESWIETARPVCLAELIARHPGLHPAEATIDGGGAKRLGRIRPELWGGYDGLEVTRTERLMTILSAKARAAFAGEAAVFVRVKRVSPDR